jgi:hypothetical protein
LQHPHGPDHNEQRKLFIMADPNLITLTIPEIHALGERLFNRGISRMTTDAPEQARDLRLAARVIWVLCLELARDRSIRVEGV